MQYMGAWKTITQGNKILQTSAALVKSALRACRSSQRIGTDIKAINMMNFKMKKTLPRGHSKVEEKGEKYTAGR